MSTSLARLTRTVTRPCVASLAGIEVVFARINPTYDPRNDTTVDGYVIPLLASLSLDPVDDTASLTDGESSFGPYTLACENGSGTITLDEVPANGTYTVEGTPLTDGVGNYRISGTFILGAVPCLTLGGDGDTVTFASVDIGAGVDVLTISADVRTVTAGTMIIAGTPQWYLYYTEGRPALFVASNEGATTEVNVRTNAAFDDGKFHSVVATFDSGTVTITVDGALQPTTTITDDSVANPYQSTNDFAVGDDDSGFTGCLKNVTLEVEAVAVLQAPFIEDFDDDITGEPGVPEGDAALTQIVTAWQWQSGDTIEWEDETEIELEA